MNDTVSILRIYDHNTLSHFSLKFNNFPLHSFLIQVYLKMLILYNFLLFVLSFFSFFVNGIYIYCNTMKLI